MATHKLKTDPQMFELSIQDINRFELRKDDRGFQVGDTLVLQETVYTGEQMSRGLDNPMNTGYPLPLRYTGREYNVRVEYILRGPKWGLKEGWVIMSTHGGFLTVRESDK